MPNLVLTTKCYNNCSYCFVDSQNDEVILTHKNVKDLLPFISSFDTEAIHLVGGEPTLNPDFIQILELLLAHGIKVDTFTNGSLSTQLVEHLQRLYSGDFSFCVNRTYPQLTPKIVQFYHKLGYRITLSVTVFQQNQKIEHIFDEILKYHLDHQFRLGISLPIWPDKHNNYLNPDEYQLVADQLFNCIQTGIYLGIKPSFDCGFPYCFFNEKQKKYFEDNEIVFTSNCGIIPDIGPDFSAMPCFPLAKFKQVLAKDSNWREVQEQFKNALSTLRYSQFLDKCNECEELQSGKCSGGCLAFRIKSA